MDQARIDWLMAMLRFLEQAGRRDGAGEAFSMSVCDGYLTVVVFGENGAMRLPEGRVVVWEDGEDGEEL